LIHLSALNAALKGSCDVFCAGSAEEAEIVLTRQVPDIVLLDIGLPGQTGYAFCRRIRSDSTFDSTRIIILSAYHTIADRLQAYESGADDYVMKPFSADEIGAKIRVYHRLLTAERQLQGNKQTLEQLLAESAQEMKKKFTTDDETGFPNGLRFSIDLRRSRNPQTVVLLNINGFGKINETYGFTSANAILNSVAERLRQIGESRGYPIYRMRGADFAFLTEDAGITAMSIAEFMADIQMEFCINPVRFSGFVVKVTFNAGVSLNETEQHLRKAALALEYSARYGRGQHGIFSEFIDIKEKYEENFFWGKIVKNAVNDCGIVPYFQGIHSNHSGMIEKYECLVRIRNDAGLYMPDRFLPAAEKLGLLTSITREMIERCFAYFQSLPYEMQFSINIVEEDLTDDGFLSFLESKFKQYRVAPRQVIFEIVETASIAGRRAMKNLEGIKKMGCLLALDDFGTENSNFARILHLKVDFIKIDGRFIGDIHRSRESFIVAKTITDFAHSIGAKAVAEFVHSPEVQWKVTEIRADYSQGYLIHQPAAEVALQ
jgi:EAL domain-containing protein (putative c-di-GMP-specific phosphodiesterase class I)/CheY-like chemotaxis protein